MQGSTSKGDQPKWKLNGYWYKADHMGYEAMAEVVASQLLSRSNLQYVAYEPIMIVNGNKTEVGCKSRDFKQKDESIITFERLHRAYYGEGLAKALGDICDVEDKLTYVVDFVQEHTKLTGVGQYLTAILELDAFLLNEDRHTNNLAVIRNETTQEYRFCPIFDNGLSLLSDLNDYSLNQDLYANLGRVQPKPVFSTDFDTQMDAAEARYGSQLKLAIKRTEIPNIILPLYSYYDASICNRVEQLLYEQIRKYGICLGIR